MDGIEDEIAIVWNDDRRHQQDGGFRFRQPPFTDYRKGGGAGYVRQSEDKSTTAMVSIEISVFIMGTIYVRAAQNEQAKFRRSGLSHQYDAYRHKTPMFIPSLPQVGGLGR